MAISNPIFGTGESGCFYWKVIAALLLVCFSGDIQGLIGFDGWRKHLSICLILYLLHAPTFGANSIHTWEVWVHEMWNASDWYVKQYAHGKSAHIQHMICIYMIMRGEPWKTQYRDQGGAGPVCTHRLPMDTVEMEDNGRHRLVCILCIGILSRRSAQISM